MLIRVHHFSLLYEPSNLPIYFILHLISGLVRGGVAGAMAGLLSVAKGLAGLPALNPAIPRNKLPRFVSIFVSCTGASVSTRTHVAGEARFGLFCEISPRILRILLFLQEEVEWVLIFPLDDTPPSRMCV